MKKEIKYYAIVATITMALILFLYTQIDASKNTIFISDSYSQYAALFSKLQTIFDSGNSFFYSFEGGLGSGFLGTFFYYLSSPFNILLFFFQDIQKFILTITTLKLITISLTALYFFRYHLKKENPIYAITFSIIYTFISFNVLYFFQIMWLDAVLILPILLVGIDKFIHKGKFLTYSLSLIYTIVTNYYFGYMACIFSFLYFNYQLLLNYSIRKEIKKIVKENLQFIGISLITVLCTSFVLFEVIHYLPGYARTTTEFLNGEPFSFQANPFSFFQRFLIASTRDVNFLNADQFFLYIGILSFILIAFYFANPSFSKKEKFLTFIIIFLLYLSVSGNYFNYVWSGFSKPQFFNGRFTFLFDFFLLYIAIKSLIKLPYLTIKEFLICSIFFILLLYIHYFTTKQAAFMYGNLFLFISYFILLFFMKKDKIYIPILIMTIALLEVEMNAILELDKYSFTAKENFQEQNDIYEFATNYIKKYDNNSFYRIETNETIPYNGPIFYQYHGIDIFLSTLSDDTANFFINIGYGSGSTKKNTISYYSGNEVIDSLLGIKYHLFINGDTIPSNYQLLTQSEIQNKIVGIYKNPDALSIGFMVNKKILDVEKNQNALEYQNNIFRAMTNTDFSIYTNIPLTEDNKKYYFDQEENKIICFYTAIDSSNGYNNPTLYLNGHSLNKIEDFEIVCTDSLYTASSKLSYSNLNNNQHLGTYAAYYEPNELKKAISYLKQNELTITEYHGNTLKGTVTSTDDKRILFTTIPYDKNWDVYVDGKKVKTVKVLDYLLGIELPVGTFKIELKYHPKQFYIGRIVSSLSFLVLLFLHKKKYFHHNQ